MSSKKIGKYTWPFWQKFPGGHDLALPTDPLYMPFSFLLLLRSVQLEENMMNKVHFFIHIG